MASLRVQSEGGSQLVALLSCVVRVPPLHVSAPVSELVDLSPAACMGLCFSFTSSGRGTGACAQQALRFSLVGTCSWLEQRGHQSLYVLIRSTGLSLVGSRSLWNMVMGGGRVRRGGECCALRRTGESPPVPWAARLESPVGPALLLSCC